MRISAILLALVAILGLDSSSRKAPAQAGPEEVWRMTLPEAIRIGLDDSEVVRCIRIGATEIPLGGFEPSPPGEPGGLGNVYDDSVPAARPGADRE